MDPGLPIFRRTYRRGNFFQFGLLVAAHFGSGYSEDAVSSTLSLPPAAAARSSPFVAHEKELTARQRLRGF
jgi:hypothetical protein